MIISQEKIFGLFVFFFFIVYRPFHARSFLSFKYCVLSLINYGRNTLFIRCIKYGIFHLYKLFFFQTMRQTYKNSGCFFRFCFWYFINVLDSPSRVTELTTATITNLKLNSFYLLVIVFDFIIHYAYEALNFSFFLKIDFKNVFFFISVSLWKTNALSQRQYFAPKEYDRKEYEYRI